MQCVILTRGINAALQVNTQGLPTSLIPVKNRPFLHYQLSHLQKQGIQDIVLTVGENGEKIERYAEDGRAWNLHIQYVQEASDALGTGGALRLAFDQNRLEPAFFVLAGDTFAPADWRPAWAHFETRTEPGLVVIYKKTSDYLVGYADFDGQKITHYDKKHPALTHAFENAGVSILRPEAVDSGIPPKSPYDLEDLLHKLSERAKLAGFEANAQGLTLATPQALSNFIRYVSDSSL